jgi:uncharacterized RDD family membrane protein YckC
MMMKHASLFKLFASCVYELLLLVAIWMLCTGLFVRLFGQATPPYKLFCLRLFLWIVTGAYFVWCWSKSGQTLAARTWKIKLVNHDGSVLSIKQSMMRYALVSLSMLAFGLGFIWALLDKDRIFLHDRLLKTRFIQLI